MKNRKSFAKFYCKQIKLLLPFYRRAERRFIKRIKTAVEEYEETTEYVDLEIIEKEFGTPQFVVSEYISNLRDENLFSHLRISRFVKRCMLFIAIFSLLIYVVVLTVAFLYDMQSTAQMVEIYIE